MQNHPTDTIDDFLISIDSRQTQAIEQLSNNRSSTSHRPIDGYRENIDPASQNVDLTNNLTSKQLRSLDHRLTIDQSTTHRPSIDLFSTTNSSMLLQENEVLKEELSEARQYISCLESQLAQEQIKFVNYLQAEEESKQQLIYELLDIVRQQLEQIQISLTHYSTVLDSQNPVESDFNLCSN